MYQSMSDIFICKNCGKEMSIKQLARHLQKIHNQKYEDYVKNNLSEFSSHGWQPCVICETISKKKTCSRECFKKHCSNLKSGIVFGPMSEETKKKLSDDRKKKYANGWAPRVGKHHSEESKEKISEKNKEFYSIKENHPLFGTHHSEHTKKKISTTRIKRGVAKGKNNPMFGKTHTSETIKKIFSHRPMNKLEKLVADKLSEAGIKYKFQFFINDKGVCRSYDFKIKGKPLILEVDGDFWHGNPSTENHYEKVDEVKENDKMKECVAKNRGYKIVRLWERDIKKDPSIIIKTLTSSIY
jgi:very-short-patch-repair endonuclease